jgi:hypothetical protein
MDNVIYEVNRTFNTKKENTRKEKLMRLTQTQQK